MKNRKQAKWSRAKGAYIAAMAPIALIKGMKAMAALEKFNADQDAAKEAERKDRILHPEKYIGK